MSARPAPATARSGALRPDDGTTAYRSGVSVASNIAYFVLSMGFMVWHVPFLVRHFRTELRTLGAADETPPPTAASSLALSPTMRLTSARSAPRPLHAKLPEPAALPLVLATVHGAYGFRTGWGMRRQFRVALARAWRGLGPRGHGTPLREGGR